MPSFDIVSEIDWAEVTNALDQANREISTRFDFKGTDARVERSDARLTVYADDAFQVNQALDVLKNKIAKRKIDLNCLDIAEVESIGGDKAKQEVTIKHGIDAELAKKLVKTLKSSKIKVQAAIQGDQVRVSGKKRDDLQQAIQMLKEADVSLPLQYTNFRD